MPKADEGSALAKSDVRRVSLTHNHRRDPIRLERRARFERRHLRQHPIVATIAPARVGERRLEDPAFGEVACELELTADIRGRDLISGLPRTVQVTTEQVREALAEPISAIVDAVKTTLDKTPPELAADIMEDGITITGGGALLGGLDQRLMHETGMPIRIADEPLYSVVIGSGRALENIDAMRGLMSLGGGD